MRVNGMMVRDRPVHGMTVRDRPVHGMTVRDRPVHGNRPRLIPSLPLFESSAYAHLLSSVVFPHSYPIPASFDKRRRIFQELYVFQFLSGLPANLKKRFSR
jgi:hypothetical protein